MSRRLMKSNPTTSLIWVDATPFLKIEQAKLRETKRKLSVAQDRVKLHQQADEPGYQTWFNATFAERLIGIRRLYEKLAELDAIVWKVEREILATGCSAAEAYDAVLKMVDEDTRAATEEKAAADDPSEAGPKAGFESELGDEPEDPWTQTLSSAKSKMASSKGEKETTDLLKQVYRALVRKLHPDLNPDLPPLLRDRWFDVQHAYGDRDLARLEMLLVACEDGEAMAHDGFIDKIQSLSRLRLLLKSVAKSLKTAQRQLAQLKRTPAWDFHRTRKNPRLLSALERETKFELRGAEDALQCDIRTLETQIKRWSRTKASTSRSARESGHKGVGKWGRGGARRGPRDWDLSFES